MKLKWPSWRQKRIVGEMFSHAKSVLFSPWQKEIWHSGDLLIRYIRKNNGNLVKEVELIAKFDPVLRDYMR